MPMPANVQLVVDADMSHATPTRFVKHLLKRVAHFLWKNS